MSDKPDESRNVDHGSGNANIPTNEPGHGEQNVEDIEFAEEGEGDFREQPDAGTLVWLYRVGERAPRGPMSPAELKRRIAGGEVSPHDLVVSDNLRSWNRAGDDPEMFADAPASALARPPRLPAWAAPGLGGIARRYLLRPLIAGLLVAVAVTAVAQSLIPLEYTASGWIRIAGTEPSLVFDTTTTASSLPDYRRAQAGLIGMPFVLQAALRDPDVSGLPILREREDPIGWLRENLDVSFPGDSDILQISLTGEDPQQVERIIVAVRDAYFSEVVARDREAQQTRLDALQAAYESNRQQIKNRNDRINNLAETQGTEDPEAVRLDRLRALDELSARKSKVNEIRAEIQSTERKINLWKIHLDKEKYVAEQHGRDNPATGDGVAHRETGNAEALELAGGMGIKDEHQAAEEEARNAREQRQFDYLMEAVLARDPSIASALDEVRSLEEMIDKERELAARDDVPGLARMEQRLEARLEWIEDRKEQLRPYLEEQVREQMDRGKGLARPTVEDQILAQIDNLELDKAVLEQEEEVALEAWNKAVEQAESVQSGSLDLEREREELERLKRIASRIGAEVDRTKIELAAAPRVAALDVDVPKEGNVAKKLRILGWTALIAFGTTFLLVALLGFAVRRVRLGRVPQRP